MPKREDKKPDLKSLTERQRRILEVIQDAVVLRGYPPSIREIGDAAGCLLYTSPSPRDRG